MGYHESLPDFNVDNDQEYDLIAKLARFYADYASALRLVELYRDEILSDTREAYQISRQAYHGGQFEYPRVLQAQQAVVEATLEYNRALGNAWVARSPQGGPVDAKKLTTPIGTKRGTHAGMIVIDSSNVPDLAYAFSWGTFLLYLPFQKSEVKKSKVESWKVGGTFV